MNVGKCLVRSYLDITAKQDSIIILHHNENMVIGKGHGRGSLISLSLFVVELPAAGDC